MPAAYAATGIAGGLYGLALKARRRDTYAAIGHGAKAALPTNSPTVLPPTPYALER